MIARAPSPRVARAVLAFAVLAAAYGIVAEIGSRALPRLAAIGFH